MSDVYKIGVQLALTGNMSAALAGIASQLLDIDNKTSSLMAKWEKLGANMKLAVGGAIATGAGVGILDAYGKLVEHGQELVHVREQLVAAGLKESEIAKATSTAWEKADRYGLKVSSVLSDIKEARMVFGSTEHAMDFIDPLEKMRVVLNSVMEGSGDKAAAYAMGRAGELKGLTQPGEFISYFDKMTKAIVASGGMVTPESFMQATQYGRLASKGWNEDFYTRILPSMIQEMGPSQTGTALMSLFGTLAQGKVSIRSLGEMQKLGLIGDESKIIKNQQGDPKGFNPGAIVGTDEFIKNPYKWAQDYLKPLVEKKLGHALKPGDEEAIGLLGGMFGNRTSAQAIATLLLEQSRIDKDAKLVDQAKGLDAADRLLENDPKAAMNNFKSAWDNLLTSFGAPLVGPAISAMNAMAGVMKSITAVAAAHPEAVKALGVGAGGAGLALAAGGSIAMSAAIWRTLFGSGGLGASATALNTSAAMLQEAAVALGAKGVPGVGGAAGKSRMGIWAGLGWASAFLAGGGAIESFGASIEKDHPWLAAILGTGSGSGKKDWLTQLSHDYIPGLKALDEKLGLTAKDEPAAWKNPLGRLPNHPASGSGGMGNPMAPWANGTPGPPPPPPPVNVNQQTQVKVQIGNQSIDAYILSVVTKAMAGFATSTPAQNTGSTMPAVDGAH